MKAVFLVFIFLAVLNIANANDDDDNTSSYVSKSGKLRFNKMENVPFKWSNFASLEKVVPTSDFVSRTRTSGVSNGESIIYNAFGIVMGLLIISIVLL